MRDRVTFIHAADLHLDAPFKGVSAVNERVGRDLAEATMQAWVRVVDHAVERDVDFVLVAGDVYDAATRSVRTEFGMRDQALRLAEKRIPLLIVHGNHDPLARVGGSGLEMPVNVHVFPAGEVERFEVVAEDGFVCSVYGRSFGKAAETEDFTPGYVRDPADTVAIGLLHSNVGGNTDYEPYAPTTVEALRAARMDYWALGHIHKKQVLTTEPYAVYAGSPQGLNPKEIDQHGCYVVELTAAGAVEIEFVPVASVDWVQAVLDVSECQGLDDVMTEIGALLESARRSAGKPVVARLTLNGQTNVHAELTRPGAVDDLTARLRQEQLAGSPWVWLDRLTDATSGVIDADGLMEAPTFAGEVVRVAAAVAAQPDRLSALVQQLAAPVCTKLTGYEPRMDHEELLRRARDRALSLLMSEGGDA